VASRTVFKVWLCTCIASSVLFPPAAYGEESRTPLAGEAFHAELFGLPIDFPERDRRHLTAVNFGVQWIPNGPIQLEVLPFGAIFVWHNWDTQRFRGTFAGVLNDVRYNIGPRSWDGWEAIFTFNNFIAPFGRSEYVEGRRIQDVEIQWNYVYAGFGIGYRKLLPSGHQDNALEISLTYEPGYLWFQRGKNTAAGFILPSDTYEGRVHFHVRADALDRNVMELPHRGYSFGGDVLYGRRAHWQNWGGVAFDAPDFRSENNYLAGSAYAVAAGGVPFVRSGRHRLIWAAYGGLGKDLDRFSAFRLPGRPIGYEWEALSLPMMPGVAFTELFPRRYGIIDLTYRYEALFFLYPYARGTYGMVERPRFADSGTITMHMDSLPALGGGIVSGAPWNSQVELNYSYNFGIFRSSAGGPTKGGHGFFIAWSKVF
jgi:hypothetical protein